MNSSYSSITKPLYRSTQVVWYVLGVVELLLLFRFALKLLGANADAVFTSLIYGATHIFVAPFLSVFSVAQVDGNILEWTTLLAMLVYWVIALSIIKLLLAGRAISTHEASRKLSEQEGL